MVRVWVLSLASFSIGCGSAIDGDKPMPGDVDTGIETDTDTGTGTGTGTDNDTGTGTDTGGERVTVPGEGTYLYVFGWSPNPEDYDCYLEYDVETYFSNVACAGCDLALEVSGERSADSYGERTCRWAPVGLFDLAIFYSRRYAQVYYHYVYGGYDGWYPIYGSTVTDGWVEFDSSYWDYAYAWYDSTYYETYVMQGSMTLPTEE